MTDAPKPAEDATAEESTETESAVETPDADTADATGPAPARTRSNRRLITVGGLSALVLALLVASAYFLWQTVAAGRVDTARTESVQAARDITVAMLTYQPDTIDEQLAAAREQLSGAWKDQYGTTVDTIIAPEAKAKRIAAAAEIAASASVSAGSDHAVVLLFINQTVAVGTEAPTITPSSVRVTLDKSGDRWLISGFEPV